MKASAVSPPEGRGHLGIGDGAGERCSPRSEARRPARSALVLGVELGDHLFGNGFKLGCGPAAVALSAPGGIMRRQRWRQAGPPDGLVEGSAPKFPPNRHIGEGTAR